jgi:CheY-like chemotaxis protein
MASILLIDDDKILRVMTTELLRAGGHAVDTANDGNAGLELYKSGQYDLVITDIMMPEMNGLQLIEQLSYTTPRPRVIAFSGGSQLSQSSFLPLAKDLGVERILAKPVMPGVLLRTVADVLTKPPQATKTQAKP